MTGISVAAFTDMLGLSDAWPFQPEHELNCCRAYTNGSDDTSSYGVYRQQIILEQWVAISLKRIETASEYKEIMWALSLTPDQMVGVRTIAKQAAIEKWCEIAMKAVRGAFTYDQMWRVSRECPPNSPEKNALRVKWQEISAKWIKRASTLEKARLAYERSLDRSEEQEEALEKWMSFCTTIEDWHLLRLRVPIGSVESHTALRKMAELYELIPESENTSS